jgi:hypothetical protein
LLQRVPYFGRHGRGPEEDVRLVLDPLESFVPAALLDYLIATEYQKRPAKDLLKLTLHEAIAACRAEGVLIDRTAQLSVVIKDYRNLIHPGRAVRLQD